MVQEFTLLQELEHFTNGYSRFVIREGVDHAPPPPWCGALTACQGVSDEHSQVLRGQFRKTTVNRYLRQWGLDHDVLLRAPPAVRFEARASNQCWQFDLSPSDLKQVKKPS
jgi:hypothetical protein